MNFPHLTGATEISFLTHIKSMPYQILKLEDNEILLHGTMPKSVPKPILKLNQINSPTSIIRQCRT